MIDEALDLRRGKFRWHSKQELCDYFEFHYGLSKKIIESEIAASMKVFKLRKGQAIRTTELWQKVGLTIERKFRTMYNVK
ncbi:MAG TPA: hypothetical protein VLX68_16760 [Chitinivibrionales bacterium]|nr:hypothetical protein [Chitinivibrionales bacterium]